MIHWFDIFVVALLLISAAWSCYRGFVRETFSLVSLVAGYIVASRFSSGLAPFYEIVFEHKKYQEIASFAVLFILSAIIINVIGIYARRALNISRAFGAVDRMVGVGVGLAKGTLILAFLVYPLALFPGLRKDFTKESKTIPELVEISGFIMGALAPRFAVSVEKADKKSKLKSSKERARTVERYRKKLDRMKAELKNKAEYFTDKLGLNTTGDKEPAGGPDENQRPHNEITETDRKELDKLIDKLD